MPFLDTSGLKVIERLPGWKGRFFHTATMTFADYEFTAGSTVHEHFHPEEEVYEVIAGELEMSVDGVSQVVRPGIVAIVPSNARHSVGALTDGPVVIVDHPARPEFGQMLHRPPSRWVARVTISHRAFRHAAAHDTARVREAGGMTGDDQRHSDDLRTRRS
jgi:mannose-6-phosphate isomerase-like protein (cupin superfamily)